MFIIDERVSASNGSASFGAQVISVTIVKDLFYIEVNYLVFKKSNKEVKINVVSHLLP